MQVTTNGIQGDFGNHTYGEIRDLLKDFLKNKEYDISMVEDVAESEVDTRNLSIAKMTNDFMKKYALDLANCIHVVDDVDSLSNLIVRDVAEYYDGPERLF